MSGKYLSSVLFAMVNVKPTILSNKHYVASINRPDIGEEIILKTRSKHDGEKAHSKIKQRIPDNQFLIFQINLYKDLFAI